MAQMIKSFNSYDNVNTIALIADLNGRNGLVALSEHVVGDSFGTYVYIYVCLLIIKFCQL